MISSSTLTPFKSRIFLAIWLASLVSSFGLQILAMAAAWLMASMETSPLMVALIQVASTSPFLLFAMVAGTLSDIYDKRKLMLTAQLVAFIASVCLAYFAIVGSINAWSLLLLIFIISSGMAFYTPVWQSSISLQVPKEHLAEAVGLNFAGLNLARSVSPAIGGILLTGIGVAWAFLVNAISYIGIIVVIFLWKLPSVAKESAKEPVFRALVLGYRYAWLTASIRVVMIRALLISFCGAVTVALMPIIARDQLSGDAATYTFILFAFGLGAVFGGVCNRWFRLRFGLQKTSLIAQLIVGFGILLCGFSSILWLSCSLLFLVGAGWMAFFTLSNSTVQLLAPKWIVGRSIAIYQTFVYGGLAAGSLCWGKLASVSSVNMALIIAGLSCLFCMWYSLKRPMPDLDKNKSETVNIGLRLPAELEIKPGLSKISLSLTYEVDSELEAEFVKAMSKLKSVRIRMGAVDWVLQQNLDNPRSWTERFIVQDWDDLIMSRSRFTDQDNQIRLKAASFDSRGQPDLVRKVMHTIHSS